MTTKSNKLFKKLPLVLGTFITICTVIGIIFKLDNRFAKADDVEKLQNETKQYISKVEKRLDLKILEDRLNATQERMWKILDRFGEDASKMPEEVKDMYRDLKTQKEKLQKQIELLSKTYSFQPPKEVTLDEYSKSLKEN